MPDLDALESLIVDCRTCPRLVAWREKVGVEKRAAFADETYWARPVPGFGEVDARLMVVGLAPAAHGANRTGRMFTGDRSGDWLFRAMHRTGFANQATSLARDDGLTLIDAWVTSPVKCAPPDNKPTTQERDACNRFLRQELAALRNLTVVVSLGGLSFGVMLRMFHDMGKPVPRPRPKFGHGVEVKTDQLTLIGSYHPSQQNTFTGRLTEPMFDAVFGRAREIIDSD